MIHLCIKRFIFASNRPLIQNTMYHWIQISSALQKCSAPQQEQRCGLADALSFLFMYWDSNPRKLLPINKLELKNMGKSWAIAAIRLSTMPFMARAMIHSENTPAWNTTWAQEINWTKKEKKKRRRGGGGGGGVEAGEQKQKQRRKLGLVWFAWRFVNVSFCYFRSINESLIYFIVYVTLTCHPAHYKTSE